MTASETYEPTEVDEPTVRKAVGAAAMGNLVEWFDYGIYSYVVAYITFNLIPGGDTGNAGPVYALAIFAVAYLVRPFGGIILGPLGDRIGRKKVLALTIVVMSAASFCIGLLPTYAMVGIAAPIMLILLRVVQGFATGGEYGGAAAFIAEYAPDKRRGFYCSFLELGTTGGFVLAAGMVTALQVTLSEGDMNSWGWRIPFLIAGPLGLVGLYLRSKLEDTPAFLALEEKAQVSESPLRDVLTKHWRPILVCMGLVLFYNVAVYTILFYMPTYLESTTGLDSTTALLYILGMMLVIMVVIIPVGALSDRVGRKPLILTSCIGFIVLSYPAFLMLDSGTALGTVSGLLILGLLLVLLLGTMSATLPALFDTDVRYGGFSIGYNISTSLFGGTAPAILALLVVGTGNNASPGIYVAVASLISLAAVLLIKESAGQPLPGSGGVVDPARRSPDAGERRGVIPPSRPRVPGDLLVHLRRARDHADRHYAEPLDLAALAAVAGISKFHFQRLFTATYGVSPAAHLSRRRVERAQDLLRATSLTVTEVCHAVGFSSLGSFSARFSELVGETPTEFQRRLGRDGRPADPGVLRVHVGAGRARKRGEARGARRLLACFL